jgi:hypothetical protein
MRPDLPPPGGTIKLETLKISLDNTNGQSNARLVVTVYPGRQYDESGSSNPLPTIPPNTSPDGPSPAFVSVNAPASGTSPAGTGTLQWNGLWACCCVTVDVYDMSDPDDPLLMVTYGGQGLASPYPSHQVITNVDVVMTDSGWSSKVTLTFDDQTTRVARQNNASPFGGTLPNGACYMKTPDGLKAVTAPAHNNAEGSDTIAASGVLDPASAKLQLWSWGPVALPSASPLGVYMFWIQDWTNAPAGANRIDGVLTWPANPVKPVVQGCPPVAAVYYFLAIQYDDLPGATQLVIYSPGGLNDGFALVATGGGGVMYQPPDTAGVVSQSWAFVNPPSS